MLPAKLLLDKSRISRWRCVARKPGPVSMLLSRWHPDSISALSWNIGTCPRNLTSIAKSAFRLKLIVLSIVHFRSQKKANVPFRLLSDNLRVWSNGEILEAEFIGIYPWRRFLERSKYSRSGSSNKDDGMLPFIWLDLKRSSRKFLKFLKASIKYAYSIVSN